MSGLVRRRALLGRGLMALALLAGAAACSSDKKAADPTFPTLASLPPSDPPHTELIATAVAALEKQLGGAQRYFEINVTGRIVNLFVALNDGAAFQHWVFQGGQLLSMEGQSAKGQSFAASALTFDSAKIFSGVLTQLPHATLKALVIEGGPGGAVRYTVVVPNSAGSTLAVVVAPDGKVISVDMGT